MYEEGRVVARVEYNNNLDFWDGNNWTCGSTGRHLGLTKLRKSGQYVLIHGTQWQGEKDSAEIITDEEAYQYIANSEKWDLLEKFPDLQKFEESIDTDYSPDDQKTTIQVSVSLKNKLEALKTKGSDETYQDVIEKYIPALE